MASVLAPGDRDFRPGRAVLSGNPRGQPGCDRKGRKRHYPDPVTSASSPPERPVRPARRNQDTPAAASADQASGVRTHPRSKDRRKSAPLAKVGMVLFFIGGLAILTDVILFASGRHDLPLWLNLCALLAPIGFAVGLLGVFLENRSAGKQADVEPTG